MQKLAKRLSLVMVAVFMLTIALGTMAPTMAKGATTYPQVEYATEPKLEYEVGDIVNFDLHTPNYGGRVQYRVVLWDNNNKTMVDLWKTPDRYYTNWMPYGNNIFNLHWKIDQPGSYRITIYVKRAGVPNNETYLKGFNCDSYMESDAFVVKAKAATTTPEVVIPAESLKLAAKSVQSVVGQEYTVKADVKKAGVKVVFLIDAPDDSMNKDVMGEAVSDASGIATYKYTRTYADADYVTAFSAAAPTVRDAQKVYWGVKPILTLTAMDKDDAASIVNGGVKQYKVKLVNPLTGEPMKYKELKVMLKENIDTTSAELRSQATVTNDLDGVRVTPYQRPVNIVPGGLNEVSLSVVTNDNGETTFTLSGYNTKATPVVWFDAYEFFNESPKTQLYRFDWNRLNIPALIPDSSQYAPTFAGDFDNRLDETELQAEAKTVSFDLTGYTFEYTMDGTKYVSVDDTMLSGRTFTVTVKKPDGTAYSRGTVNVRLEELFDNTITNDCEARIIGYDTVGDELLDSNAKIILAKSFTLNLTSSGKATFMVVSDTINDIATPRVWVDQDTRDAHLGYVRDGLYTQGEPTKVLDTLFFVNEAVESGGLTVERDNEDIEVIDDADGNVMNLGGETTNFIFNIFDQNGNEWIPDGSKVLLTYTLTNIGARPISIKVPNTFANPKIDNHNMTSTYSLKTNETITISGIDDNDESMIQAYTAGTTDYGYAGKLSVKVHAVVTKSHDQEFPAEWWWLQPSNTTGAMVSDGEAIGTWAQWYDYSYYTGDDIAVRGKVVALQKNDVPNAEAADMVVIDLDNEKGTYLKIDYTPNTRCPLLEYVLAYPDGRDAFHPIDFPRFEYQLSLEDSLYYILDSAAGHGYFRLYNADISNDLPEIDYYELTLNNPEATVTEGANLGFDYVATTTGQAVRYNIVDQYDDLINSDDNYMVYVSVNGVAQAPELLASIDKFEDIDVTLVPGINTITAYLRDLDGVKVVDSDVTIKVLYTIAKYGETTNNTTINGTIVGVVTTTGELVVNTTLGYVYVELTHDQYAKMMVDGNTVTNADVLLANLSAGDKVVIKFLGSAFHHEIYVNTDVQ